MTTRPISEEVNAAMTESPIQDATQPRPLMRDRYHEQLDEVDRRLAELGDSVIEALTSSVEALDALDVTRAKALIEGDGQIDATRHEIDEQAFYLLATQQPTASDLRLLTAVSSVTGELERIADHCAGIAKLTLTMAGEPRGEPNPAIRKMAEITTDLLRGALGAFRGRDAGTAGNIWSRDDEVDDLYQEFFRHQIEEMVNHKKRVRRGTYMLWVAHNIERVADRVTNIAEAVAFVATGDVAAWREQIEAETVPPSF